MALTPAERARHARALAIARLQQGQAAADRAGKPQPRGPGGGPNGQWRDGQIRAILRAHHYNVEPTGGYTARAHSAWTDYLATRRNNQDPHQAAQLWNKSKIGRSDTVDRHPVGGTQTNTHGAYGGRGGAYQGDKAGAGKQPKGTVTASLDKAVSKVGKTTATHVRATTHAKNLGAGAHKGGPNGIPGVATGGAAVNQLVPSSYADKVAGVQFDPIIAGLKSQQTTQSANARQALADIANWYGDVKTAQGTATTRDAAAGHAARDDVSNAIQGIVQSLGGSRGAGLVGAQGAADLGAIAQQGQAQDQFNADLAPLLQQEQAGASTRQNALDSQKAADLASQLTAAQGQRGDAKAQALMQIIGLNNQARQSNFQNRLSLSSAGLAAASLGLDQAKTAALLGQYAMTSKLNQQKVNAIKNANKNAKGWGALNPTDRATIIGRAVQAGLAQIPSGAPWDPGHVQNTALAYLRTYGGLGSARKLGYKGRVPSRGNQGQILGALNQAITAAGQKYGQPTQ